MEAAKKSFEIQSKIRNNAEEFKNTLNDLYSWQKEIKDKEHELLVEKEKDSDLLKTLPVRSHVVEQTCNKEQETLKKGSNEKVDVNTNKSSKDKSMASPPTPVEKCDIPLASAEKNHNIANEIKDRGNKHVKNKEYEKAINEYSAAIKLCPEDPIYYNNRALCYLKLERYEPCIQDCDRAIEIDKLAVKAYYRRMQANEYLDNYMDALKDCTTVLMIEPKNLEAKKSLERINERLRKNVKSVNGPNFSPLRQNLIDILPIEKPPYKRSTVPLRRVPIADVVGPKDSKNYENTNLQISDEEIDKLFNSNCGPFVEIKKPTEPTNKLITTKTTAAVAENKTVENIPATTSKTIKHVESVPTTSNKAGAAQVSDAIATKSIVDTNKKTKSEAKTDAQELLVNTTRPLPPSPTSTAQFYSNWKELPPAQKYQYLKSIEVPRLCKILGAGFDSDTLTDILHTLHNYYLPNKEPTATIAETLLEVSKNNQITILSMLMSSDERKVLSEIANAIKECDGTPSLVATIAKNFNLN